MSFLALTNSGRQALHEDTLPEYDTERKQRRARERYKNNVERYTRSWRALLKERNADVPGAEAVIRHIAESYACQIEQTEFFKWLSVPDRRRRQ